MDDIIVIRNDEEKQKMLKENLAQEFEIKDLGILNYFLGIEVAYSRLEFSYLNVNMYWICWLKQGWLEAKALVFQWNLTASYGRILAISQLIREDINSWLALIYLSHTRPNIAFAINLVSQFMHNPTEEHK